MSDSARPTPDPAACSRAEFHQAMSMRCSECGHQPGPDTAARLKAAYDEARAEGSGPGVPRADLKRLRLKGTYRPHPFIEFPLWGLEQALADHMARCSACSGNTAAVCDQQRYSDMLRDKIERLSRG